MNETPEFLPTVSLILLLFPLAFGLLWGSILQITSRLGGWHRLAERYPDHNIPEKYTEFMSSGRMGWMNYNGVLKLHAGARGLHLAVVLPFRPGHAPVCLPWHAFRVEDESSFTLIKLVRLEIQHQGRPLSRILLRAATAERLQLASRSSG